MPRLLTLLTLAAASGLLLTAATSAHATNPAAAQVLFETGKRLMSQHQFARACSTFEESQKLDPGLGTLFHYADCEERLGKVATAWATFLDVSSEAKAQGEKSRDAAARARASALEPRLARLAIGPGAERATPGLELVRDGEVIGAGQWAVEVPLDPGDHVVMARAPGKGSWRTTLTLKEGAHTLVTVPLLADVPAAPSVASTAPIGEAAARVGTTSTTGGEEPLTPHRRGHAARVAGVVMSAAGVAGLGVGAYFGITSLLDHQSAVSHCPAGVCDANGSSFQNDSRRDAELSAIALATGGTALIAGILTYIAAPRSEEISTSSRATRPIVAVGPGGVSVSGAW